VQVDAVGVGGEVEDLPDLDGVGARPLEVLGVPRAVVEQGHGRRARSDR
jgi:hypothetical protein